MILCAARMALTIFLVGCTQSNTATHVFEGQSMAPTIADRDKFVEVMGQYEQYENWKFREEVLLFVRMTDKSTQKRVVALPGESIRFEDRAVIINGEPIEYESIPTDRSGPTEEINLLEYKN